MLGTRRRELTLLESWQAYAQRFDLEMVFTQMTQGRVLARGRRWDHVTDFHRFVVDDDSVDPQRYQQDLRNIDRSSHRLHGFHRFKRFKRPFPC